LTGPAIVHSDGADLVSEGIAHGAVQVPGDGQPIVLLAARQTVGGYVKIATMIGADLDRFAQLRPGQTVRFVAVTVEAAREATLGARAALGSDAIVVAPAGNAGWGPGRLAATIGGTRGVANGNVWDPAGVVRVIEAATAARVTSLRLEVADAGLKLELRRGEDGALVPFGPAAPDRHAAVASPGETLVTAPVLCVFYRRPGADQPPLVAGGDEVAAGQTIGLLEVMKTYHEVRAPHAGKLVAFLVDDGQFVEYGQPIAKLARTEGTNGTS
jgi:biotin carboxyl carrier protein